VSRKLIESLNFAADDASHSESGLQRPDMKGKSAQISKANQLDDLRRATGDMEVYRYYFRSIGWPQGTLFVSFVIMNVFCSSFSGESFLWAKTTEELVLADATSRNMAEMVDRHWRRAD